MPKRQYIDSPVEAFLRTLHGKEYRGMLAHLEEIPAQEAEYRKPSPALPPELAKALQMGGIEELYSHQCQALEMVRSGINPVLVTPTASGKTLSYNLPVLEEFLRREGGHALYLFPLKALEQDQLKQLQELTSRLPNPKRFQAVVYDGDTPENERRQIRSSPPRFILTNPEMLHLTISGFHRSWGDFLKNLKFIVIDELHSYKGIFGSHMSQIFRRLDRICEHYGSHPQYICCSATIANPVELAENLTGKRFQLIDKSGAPMAKRHFVFLNPEVSPYTTASKLFRRGIALGMKTIAFTKARKITELIYQWVTDQEPELKGKVSAYRAGFLPEERREIEKDLSSGKLWGVISTSALEMGVDIGTLDLGILVGYPGTISQTFQRGGRVGRKQQSVVVMIGQQNALDQYFMTNPGDFFQRNYEAAVVDQSNKYILKQHLLCAAAEIALTKGEKHYAPDKYPEMVAQLEQSGQLQVSADGKRWFCLSAKPHRDLDLRSAGAMFTITDPKGRIIGSIGGANVYAECHPGAIYLHMGKQFQVEELDLAGKNIKVKTAETDYYTAARSQKDTTIIKDREAKQMRNFKLHIGELQVTEWMTGYEKRRLYSQELMGVFPLDLPEQSYETVGIWMEIPRTVREYCEEAELHFMGGIHGLEHAMLSLTPLFALCDRGDMGGISMVEHSGVQGPAIFLYDGYPGGIGLAERTYEIFEQLLERTFKLVKGCKCQSGCPSCIHSPRCGSGNYPLDKTAVLTLLEGFAGKGDFALKKVEKTVIEKIFPVSQKSIKSEIKVEPKVQPVEKSGEILIFDLETQHSAEEVGGWSHIDKMKLAAAVTMNADSGRYRIYYEEEAGELITALKKAKLVVGFNVKRFDYEVLRPYGLTNPGEISTLDMLLEVQKAIGHRLSLGALAKATLQAAKSADGLQSIEWFKEGRLDLITEYCQQDVRLTRELYRYGQDKGHLLYEDKNKGVMQV